MDYIQREVAVLGISTDSVASHQRFAAQFSLPFPLLSDSEGRVCRDYGVLKNLIPPGSTARRVSFLIDKSGLIEKIWDPVSAKTHHAEVMNYLEGK